MKLHDRIVITCTTAFKERFERARKKVAQRHTTVPSETEIGRQLIGKWSDGQLGVEPAGSAEHEE
jgi:hypothetical protein